MPVTMVNDTWEFCTNGYPDPDVLIKYLKLVRSNAVAGICHYGVTSMIARGYDKLVRDIDAELATMENASE